jgi:hypothetical protein
MLANSQFFSLTELFFLPTRNFILSVWIKNAGLCWIQLQKQQLITKILFVLSELGKVD